MKAKSAHRTVIGVWALLVVAGFVSLDGYAHGPGPADVPPPLWPEGAGPAPTEDTLLVFLHPRCPCSRATVEQLDPRTDRVMRVTLSLAQARDLAAALNLPEGIYRRAELGKARP